MKLVAAKCPSCGANIDVDVNSDMTKCDFCNTKIIVEDAIEQLRIELSGQVEIKNLPKLDNYLKNGERYYYNGEWNEAYKQYNKAVELEPDNFVAVLRNGICNTLDTNYFGYNLNPLENGIKESLKILGDDCDDKYYNQVAKEGFDATNLMESFANNYFSKGLCDYDEMLENQKKLLGCLHIYTILEEIAKSAEIKRIILKTKINLVDSLIASRNYRTGRYRNGNEIIDIYIPPKSLEKNLYNIRNRTANEYNKLVPEKLHIRIKKQPIVRFDSKIGKFIMVIVLTVMFVCAFLWAYPQIKKYSNNSNEIPLYDYVQNCDGLETVRLIDIYEAYENDSTAAKEMYLDKPFIFEGTIYHISTGHNPYIQIDSEYISPYIYVNNGEVDKLNDYSSGDNIRVCGIVKKIHELGDPVRVENATIIN